MDEASADVFGAALTEAGADGLPEPSPLAVPALLGTDTPCPPAET